MEIWWFDSQCTVRYADAEGGRPRLLLGLQVYLPASSGFTWEMMSEPSIRILTLRFKSLDREKQRLTEERKRETELK